MTIEERHADEQYCYLTTTGRRTGKRHEIEIWFAAVGDTIYLMNGSTRRGPSQSDWVRNLQANPEAEVRITAERFSGTARMVVFDSDEHERARTLLVAKYATSEQNLATWRATAYPVAIELSDAAN